MKHTQSMGDPACTVQLDSFRVITPLRCAGALCGVCEVLARRRAETDPGSAWDVTRRLERMAKMGSKR